MRRLALLTTVLLFALAVAAAAKPRAAKFKTGTYSAKTSQGSNFKFKIEAHTAADHCGTSASSHCFIAISYPRSPNRARRDHAAAACSAFPTISSTPRATSHGVRW